MRLEDALIKLDWPIKRVMEQIERNGQAIALAIDPEGKPLATVTDGDIRRAILSGVDLDLPVQALIDQRPVDQGASPIIAQEGVSDAALLRLMSDASIRHVPVVDSSGRVTDIALLSELIKGYDLPVTAVVMAGGRGSRLHPLTEDTPKPMLEVGGRPLLESIIKHLHDAGVRRINVTTHYKKEAIESHFGDGRDFGVEIQYVEEDQPLGTAGSLGLLEASDKPLLVINGDILTKVDFQAMTRFHQKHEADMTVAVRPQEIRLPYGVVETNGALITSISEKPVIRHFMNAGIYLLNPQVCSFVPPGQKYDMTDLIQRLLTEGMRVASFPVHEYWLDIGQLEDYQRAQAEIEQGVA